MSHGVFARQGDSHDYGITLRQTPFRHRHSNWVAHVDWVRKGNRNQMPATAGGSTPVKMTLHLRQAVSINKLSPPTRHTTTTLATPTCRTSSTSGCVASLRSVFPDFFATLAVPKAEELVADSLSPWQQGEGRGFFLNGMTLAMQRLAEAHPAFPVTIYYAFKQSESKRTGAMPVPAGKRSWMQ